MACHIVGANAQTEPISTYCQFNPCLNVLVTCARLVDEFDADLRCYGVTLCVEMIYHMNNKCYSNKAHN